MRNEPGKEYEEGGKAGLKLFAQYKEGIDVNVFQEAEAGQTEVTGGLTVAGIYKLQRPAVQSPHEDICSNSCGAFSIGMILRDCHLGWAE